MKTMTLTTDEQAVVDHLAQYPVNSWQHGSTLEDIALFCDMSTYKARKVLRTLRDKSIVLAPAPVSWGWIYCLKSDPVTDPDPTPEETTPAKSREKYFQAHLSTGNEKVPYYIFNLTSATNCESLKLDLCPVAEICYAKKAEIQYPAVEPYRDRQTQIWDTFTEVEIVLYLENIQGRSKSMPKVLRFDESGDFRHQADVWKMAVIAELLKTRGWKVYTYTARTDLDLSYLIPVCQVNLSNDHAEYVDQGANRFLAVDEPSGDNFLCRGDCRKCKVCMNVRSKTIEVIKH